MIARAELLYKWAVILLAVVSGVLLLIVTVWIGLEAIVRSMGFGTLKGVIDFTDHSLYTIAFLAAPWILYGDGHVRVTVFVDGLPQDLRRPLMIATEIAGLVLCAVLTAYATKDFIVSYQRGELIFQELVIPEWWVEWQSPLAFALLSIGFLRRTLLLTTLEQPA